MRILLTGASGLLGGYLLQTGKDRDIFSTWHNNALPIEGTHMDLAVPSDIFYAFNKSEPDVVIHTAGIGSVDRCEYPDVRIEKINVTSLRYILEGCIEYAAKLVYISTNAVFDGREAPYREDSPRFPINRYGKMKQQAENLVFAHPYPWLVVRPILLYGWPWPGGRGNWATRALQAIKEREVMQIVNDRWTQPTYAGACAKAIWELLDKDCTGVYHIGGLDRMTLYDFCRAVAESKGRGQSLFEPVGSEMFRTLAPRPVDTTYDLSKIRAEGVELVGVANGLRMMLVEDRCTI